MNLTSGKPAKRVRIYVNDSDHIGIFPLPQRIVELLRRHNAAGATVFRGGIGFGTSGLIHTPSHKLCRPWSRRVLVGRWL